MSSSRWRFLKDESWHWKAHVVNDDLVHAIEGDLYDRAVAEGVETCVFLIEDQTDEAYFDLPGMVLQNRSHRNIDLNGLKLVIPSEDLSTILADVKLLPERSVVIDEQPVTYYKLHGWRYCIVLSADERRLLIEEMEKQVADAEVEAEVDRQRFLKAMEGQTNVISAKAEAIKKANAGNPGAN